jgi:hypothetical protein
MYKNNKTQYTESTMCNHKESKMTNDNSDLFRKYLHDIRNMKTLDEEMIHNIRNMSSDDKMDIIIAFNGVVENLKIFIDE